MANELAAWLLEQLARDEQTARAMPHALEGLQARWSPSKLIADCQAKRTVVELILRRDDSCTCDVFGHHMDNDAVLQHLAQPYAHLKGYREEWKP